VSGPPPGSLPVLPLASVHTGNPARDDHLRSPDFFDTGHTPQMTFRSTALRPAGAAAGWVLTGDLTIRHTTRPVELQVEFLGVDPAGLQGETRIGFSARGTISRRDFGITFGLAADGSRVIGDKVDISLDVEAILNAE
jgi:polyisoprenoid-binding protein YceI